MRLIDADALKELILKERDAIPKTVFNNSGYVVGTHYKHGDSMRGGIRKALRCMEQCPTIEAEPVKHGRWILEAHNERVNYRWNVTAECSECCDEEKEIWAGFFPGVPDSMAREAALISAESVKLSNYCPNCGAKMGYISKDIKR